MGETRDCVVRKGLPKQLFPKGENGEDGHTAAKKGQVLLSCSALIGRPGY